MRDEQGEGDAQGGEDCASMSSLLETEPGVCLGTNARKDLEFTVNK